MRDTPEPERLLRAMFDAAVAAAQPDQAMAAHLPPLPHPPAGGRLVVLGAGKAAAAMARAAEQHYGRPLEGLVITRYGHRVPCDGVEVVEAAHPVPDAAGQAAARRMLALAESLTAADTALCLISGGGSALLTLPAEGITLDDKQAINRALLRSGATIGEMNTLRRHLSAVKGGRLAAACHPARVVTLLISDVPGDAPADIASGPTVADPTTCAEALEITARHAIALPAAVREGLASGALESIAPGDPRLADTDTRLIATPQMALEAAAAVAEAAGVTAHILGDALEGEARELGTVLAGIARQVARRGQPFAPPCVLLSGGETTVTLRHQGGPGRGGRNVECLMAMALGLDALPGVWALAGDTDGVDGAMEVAGAVIGPDTLARAAALGLSPRAALEAHDAHGFFERVGGQVLTGPTLTNVNDFRAVLVLA